MHEIKATAIYLINSEGVGVLISRGLLWECVQMFSGPVYLDEPWGSAALGWCRGESEAPGVMGEAKETPRGVTILGIPVWKTASHSVGAAEVQKPLGNYLNLGEKWDKSACSSVWVKLSKLLSTIKFVLCIFFWTKFFNKGAKLRSCLLEIFSLLCLVSSCSSLPLAAAARAFPIIFMDAPCFPAAGGTISGSANHQHSNPDFLFFFSSLIATTQLQSVIFPTHIF